MPNETPAPEDRYNDAQAMDASMLVVTLVTMAERARDINTDAALTAFTEAAAPGRQSLPEYQARFLAETVHAFIAFMDERDALAIAATAAHEADVAAAAAAVTAETTEGETK